MPVPELSLSDLKKLTSNKPQEIAVRLICLGLEGQNYESFIGIVEDAIDWISQKFARNPELRKDRSEDEISIDLITSLCSLGFDASHDEKTGGHCDVTINVRQEYIWMGEAKKVTGVDISWLYKGYLQLSNRYSTGMPGQDSGGILIYANCPRIDHVRDSWEKYLQAKIKDVTTTRCSKNDLAFFSEHLHERTGRVFRIRHLPVSLYFEPRE